MPRFMLLTDLADDPVMVNVNDIVAAILSLEHNGATSVVIRQHAEAMGVAAIRVKETPEVIFNSIEMLFGRA
ncbi:hypothetical protein [Methylobacterium ajmalii]|jgi:hypothetical protein|uniref:hypothetical protein n=1 Tax=Methylobacterium ajmalii TaxID=2738439 RepID=UPI00190A09C6|nr:hypothetical protein [Methylobacterium ajmalii]MBK3400412.1 hypothetical protein [Methylobacterium ajmalii]MBK3407546.1 hypothetical protein [Methylobacterium ajmalii]MBK3422106.1 hypothetical protein [Methylobacterium ajmalii]MBZ6415624.1 hypothetical protein [Methylobacterium sp.]